MTAPLVISLIALVISVITLLAEMGHTVRTTKIEKVLGCALDDVKKDVMK